MSITQCDNGAHQYHYYQLRPLKNDSGNYTYTFEFPDEQFQFWKPFSIAVAVNNSVKLSPFSDYAVIRKGNQVLVIGYRWHMQLYDIQCVIIKMLYYSYTISE